MKCVDKAINWVVKNWDKVPSSGYPNSADLLVVAHMIKSTCETNITEYNLDLDENRALLTTVGDYMFDHVRVRARGGEVSIRRRPAAQLKEEMQTLSDMLTSQMISIGVGELALLKGLFLTASYYTMSTITRSDSHTAESQDTVDRRLATYRMLVQISAQNQWARAGVILARIQRPNTPMVENWIPDKSLYWQDLFSQQDVEV